MTAVKQAIWAAKHLQKCADTGCSLIIGASPHCVPPGNATDRLLRAASMLVADTMLLDCFNCVI